MNPWSDSTEFRRIARGSSDWRYTGCSESSSTYTMYSVVNHYSSPPLIKCKIFGKEIFAWRFAGRPIIDNIDCWLGTFVIGPVLLRSPILFQFSRGVRTPSSLLDPRMLFSVSDICILIIIVIYNRAWISNFILKKTTTTNLMIKEQYMRLSVPLQQVSEHALTLLPTYRKATVHYALSEGPF